MAFLFLRCSQVDSRNGLGYWVGLGEPIVVFKTNGNEGDAQMVGGRWCLQCLSQSAYAA